MKKNVRRVLIAALALVFAVSAIGLIRRGMDYRKGEETYSEAKDLAGLPDLSGLPAPTLMPEPAPGPSEPAQQETDAPEDDQPPAEQPVYVDPYADALRNMDFTALRAVNGDVLGWILIPGTAVSYPLLQGEDNEYYLNRTWKGWRSAVGSIFLEWRNSGDLSDFNTVVYGHRMRNGSMFASLKYYDAQSYWAAHPCVYITDDGGSHKYDVFAAYEVSTEGLTYRIGFSGDEDKQEFIDYCLEQSVIDTGIVPTVYDKVLTLSTCTGDGYATRWVVQAVLKGVAPSDEAQAAPQESGPVEPSAEPTDVPAAEPSAEPTAEPAAEPAVEPAAEPTAEPATVPADGAADLPAQPAAPAPTPSPTPGPEGSGGPTG